MTEMNVRNIKLSLHLFKKIFLGESEFEVLLKSSFLRIYGDFSFGEFVDENLIIRFERHMEVVFTSLEDDIKIIAPLCEKCLTLKGGL